MDLQRKKINPKKLKGYKVTKKKKSNKYKNQIKKINKLFSSSIKPVLILGGGIKYGEVRLQDEIEFSKYSFGNVAMSSEEFSVLHRELFDKYYSFADTLLSSGLILPALEHCLKCSHLFNILDSSGSIGVTERAAFVLRVRQLAVKISKAYLETRE